MRAATLHRRPDQRKVTSRKSFLWSDRAHRSQALAKRPAAVLGAALASDAEAAAVIESYAIVQDDATLRVRGQTVRLYGVYVADLRPFCDSTFRPARCQTRAAVALASRIQGFVRCVPQVRYEDRSIGAFCSVKGTGTPSRQIDLGAWLIEQGWAVALPQAPFAYHTLEEIAKANGRGVWGFQADRIIIR